MNIRPEYYLLAALIFVVLFLVLKRTESNPASDDLLHQAYRALPDFDLALKLIRQLPRTGYPLPGCKLAEGEILFYSAQYPAARHAMREALAKEQNPKAAAVILSALAKVLAAEGWTGDALRIIERSIEANPDRGGAYSALADVRLQQGDFKSAFAASDVALKHQTAAHMESGFKSNDYAVIWANRAWALAETGEVEAAREAVGRALSEASHDCAPELAGVYYRVARALLAAGDTQTASHHLNEASTLDPKGHYGQRARSLLQNAIEAGGAES